MPTKKSNTDNKTLDLIKAVQAKKEQIAKAERPNWKTNCSFSYVEGVRNNAINLHVESRLTALIGIAAFLLAWRDVYERAAKVLSVDSPPKFQWDGFSVEDWIEDIKTRIVKIQIASERQKLEVLEARLERIVSPELRAQIELEAIESELAL